MICNIPVFLKLQDGIQLVVRIQFSGIEFDRLINEYDQCVHIFFVKGSNCGGQLSIIEDFRGKLIPLRLTINFAEYGSFLQNEQCVIISVN